jgi:hypothetical protein
VNAYYVLGREGWFGHADQPFDEWWRRMTRDGPSGDGIGYLRDRLKEFAAAHPDAEHVALVYPPGFVFMGLVRR